ncbi:unnamed protein product [Gadus morhua 'NCC']
MVLCTAMRMLAAILRHPDDAFAAGYNTSSECVGPPPLPKTQTTFSLGIHRNTARESSSALQLRAPRPGPQNRPGPGGPVGRRRLPLRTASASGVAGGGGGALSSSGASTLTVFLPVQPTLVAQQLLPEARVEAHARPALAHPGVRPPAAWAAAGNASGRP